MFEPTEEQLAVVDFAQSSEDNLLISAYAGAAKTSTLELLAKGLPSVEMLYLVFNKKNADEAKMRMPSNVHPMTLNALGHRTWSEATGRRLRIESSKTYSIIKELVDNDPCRDILYENFAELIRVVDFGKACGYVPTGKYVGIARRLMDCDEFFNHIEQKLTDLEIDIVRVATLLSLEQAFQGLCNYDDQILMPTIFQGAFPRYKLTLVDEAQDLSALNHATLRKMVGQRRLIAVGDPCQAIYGFRGAHQESMELLREEFSMSELPLTTSFRCPIEVVKHAQWRAPNMRWPDWAVEGEVRYLDQWTPDDLPEAATIICRNNAPLFRLAIKLLMNGRPVELHGKDVVTSLTKIMRKFGGSDLKQMVVLDMIDAWEEKQKAKNKARGHGSIEDRAECMRIFTMQGPTLGDALAYAQALIQMHSPLKMMTGHGAKGLEFDYVFFLDSFLVGKDEQEPNLRYVIITRAKKTLTYIESNMFVPIRELEHVSNN